VTLIVNKNVKDNTFYDQQQDLVRAKMEIAEMTSEGDNVKIVFGHIAPKQCNMRIYRAKTAGWAEFKEK
jgi:hypothetical protein